MFQLPLSALLEILACEACRCVKRKAKNAIVKGVSHLPGGGWLCVVGHAVSESIRPASKDPRD